MKNKFSYIIWDWNGTLIDDAWLFVELMNTELQERHLPLINVEDYRKNFTFPVKKYYENLGFDFKKEDFQEVGYNFIEKFKKRKFEAHLFPQTIEILTLVQNLGIKQSILSAQEHALLNKTVTHYKIDSYFETILITINDYLVYKFLSNKINYYSIHINLLKLIRSPFLKKFYKLKPKNIYDIKKMIEVTKNYINNRIINYEKKI